MGEGFGHVASAVAEADVAGFVIHGARKEEDACFQNELVAEGLDILISLETGEADGAGVGRGPLKGISVTGKERGELREISQNNLKIAIDEFLAVAECEGGEKFAGGAGTDGGVVLKGDNFLEESSVARGDPAET